LLGPAVLLAIVTGCSSRQETSRKASPKPLPVDLSKAEFIGDAACAPCHPAEAAKQARTAHAATLRIMDRASLGPLAPPAGKIPRSDIVLGDAPGGRYTLGIAGEQGEPMDLSYAVGSGKTGMTHVALMEDNQLLELSRSYFPAGKKWYVTPGHQTRRSDQVGMVYTPKQARECFLCHAVTVPSYGVAPSPGFFGVGCEACHGPGSVHVDAAKSGQPIAGTVERIAGWKSKKVNDLCGRCHRTQQSVAMKTSQSGMTNRFQAYGLMKSRCFKESGEALSCVTCHDPHTNTSRVEAHYEAACLKCHEPAVAAGPAAGKPCPVNPKTGCVPCHMPKRAVFKNTEIPTMMADHFITVHRTKSAGTR
jgi:hypothetical protein